MAEAPVNLFLPNRIKRKGFARLPKFYDLLERVLLDRGLEVQKWDQDAYSDPQFEGGRCVTYHTKIARPNWLNVKGSYLKEFFHVDPEGYAGFSSMRNRWFEPDQVHGRKARKFYDRLHRYYVEGQRTKYGKFDDAGAEIPEGCVAVFLQKQDDVTVDLAHMTTAQMIETVLASRRSRPVVIKRHPWCQDDRVREILAGYASDKAEVFICQANVHTILEKADHVACVNSGTGFEALLHLKPVTLFGRSDYFPATTTCRDPIQGPDLLSGPAPKPDWIKKFLYWYLAENLVSPRFCDPEKQLHRIFESQGWGT